MSLVFTGLFRNPTYKIPELKGIYILGKFVKNRFLLNLSDDDQLIHRESHNALVVQVTW